MKFQNEMSVQLQRQRSIHGTRVLVLCRPPQDVDGHCTILCSHVYCISYQDVSYYFKICCVFFHPDTWAQIVIPQTNIDVIKGEMVILKVSYRTDSNHDLSTDTILWNFVSNKTQLVRFCFRGKDNHNLSMPDNLTFHDLTLQLQINNFRFTIYNQFKV